MYVPHFYYHYHYHHHYDEHCLRRSYPHKHSLQEHSSPLSHLSMRNSAWLRSSIAEECSALTLWLETNKNNLKNRKSTRPESVYCCFTVLDVFTAFNSVGQVGNCSQVLMDSRKHRGSSIRSSTLLSSSLHQSLLLKKVSF